MLEKEEEGLNVEKVIEEFEDLTKHAERVQRETLRKILEANASAEYLQNLGLNGRTDPESFKACVPLVTHKDLEPYIQRIIDGDASSVLTGKPITTMSLRSFLFYCFSFVVELNWWCYKFLSLRFSCSSGTTQGKPKFVPWNDELFETTFQTYQTSFAFRNR